MAPLPGAEDPSAEGKEQKGRALKLNISKTDISIYLTFFEFSNPVKSLDPSAGHWANFEPEPAWIYACQIRSHSGGKKGKGALEEKHSEEPRMQPNWRLRDGKVGKRKALQKLWRHQAHDIVRESRAQRSRKMSEMRRCTLSEVLPNFTGC